MVGDNYFYLNFVSIVIEMKPWIVELVVVVDVVVGGDGVVVGDVGQL